MVCCSIQHPLFHWTCYYTCLVWLRHTLLIPETGLHFRQRDQRQTRAWFKTRRLDKKADREIIPQALLHYKGWHVLQLLKLATRAVLDLYPSDLHIHCVYLLDSRDDFRERQRSILWSVDLLYAGIHVSHSRSQCCDLTENLPDLNFSRFGYHIDLYRTLLLVRYCVWPMGVPEINERFVSKLELYDEKADLSSGVDRQCFLYSRVWNDLATDEERTVSNG